MAEDIVALEQTDTWDLVSGSISLRFALTILLNLIRHVLLLMVFSRNMVVIIIRLLLLMLL
jgi:hypothetical protein